MSANLQAPIFNDIDTARAALEAPSSVKGGGNEHARENLMTYLSKIAKAAPR